MTAYSVQQRERELAIRMALGAGRGAVAEVVFAGKRRGPDCWTCCRSRRALAATRLLEHQVFGVQTFDISTLAATSALMVTTWLVATWWPARRASRTDPAVSLKEG